MILVDPPTWPGWGRTWSHLVSDSSLAELHEFAQCVGLPRRLFDEDHYDVPVERYDEVVAAGADVLDIGLAPTPPEHPGQGQNGRGASQQQRAQGQQAFGRCWQRA